MDDYPGAAAAYSLRLLSTDYTGDAIVVRRSSDNATQNIGFVDGELDTGALNTFCTGTDGFVTTWFDQSGNGVNAVQTTASSQPKIYDSVTGVILENGKNAVQFDNIDHKFSISVADDFFGLNDITTIIVSKNASSSELGGLMQKRNAFADGNFGIGSANGRYEFQTRDTATSNLAINTVSIYNTQQIISIYRNSTGIYFNSPEVISTAGAKADLTSSGGFDFGTGQSYGVFGGTIQEAIIYLSDESSNLNDIEDNINNYYSIY